MTKTKTSKPVRQRAELLESIIAQEQVVLAISQLDEAEQPQGESYNMAMERLNALYDTYENRLQKIELSRCPYTGETVPFIIDCDGVDGPYWDANRPIRPLQSLPPTVFAYTGAIDIDRPKKKIIHEIKPGPGQPFLIPRIMQIEGMKAVISSLKIGEHDAFAIFYFHKSPPYDVPHINYWGTRYHVAEWQENCSYTLDIPDLEDDFDFNITPYLESGSAHWIAPDDDNLQLRSTPFDYPYQHLTGRQFPVLCVDGKAINSFYFPADMSEDND